MDDHQRERERERGDERRRKRGEMEEDRYSMAMGKERQNEMKQGICNVASLFACGKSGRAIKFLEMDQMKN